LATFTNKRDPHGPQPDLARLSGVRLVTISEVESGGTMALLKRATGGDPIQTRSHHQETFEFTPQFTLWLMANDRPRVSDTDTGLWRRIREIPFSTVFNLPDPTIRQRLADPHVAGPAVLAWAVAGCLAWRREGLGDPPGQVAAATGEYRAEMDPLSDFLEDCTVAAPDAWTSSADLFDAYTRWADTNRVSRPLGSKAFSQRLTTRYPKERHPGDRDRGFRGIGLVVEP
jgi:putative DNA primase/helicase